MPDSRGDPLPAATQEEVSCLGVREEEGPAKERLLPPARPRGALRHGAEKGGLRLKEVDGWWSLVDSIDRFCTL